MKSIHLMTGLALFASISTGFAVDEAQTRRVAIEKAIAKEQPLHKQIQLAIFDAFETRAAGVGPSGAAFYNKYNFVPEKFIKLACERNFTGKEAMKSIDFELNELNKHNLKWAQKDLKDAQKRNDASRIKFHEKRIKKTEGRIKQLESWKSAVTNPKKTLPTDPLPKFFVEKLRWVSDSGVGALGAGPADHIGAVDHEVLKKTFHAKGMEKGNDPLFKIGGDIKMFAEFYSEVCLHHALKHGNSYRSSVSASTEALTIWKKSGDDISKARALFKKKK